MDLGFGWYFLSLHGRISRQEFWLGQGLIGVLLLLLAVKAAFALPASIIDAVVFWPVVAIAVKRLHDLDMSGWWVGMSLAMCAVSATVNDCSLSFLFATTEVLAGLPSGTRGANRFGADPLAASLA